MNKLQLTVNPDIYIVLAISLLVLPVKWVIAWLLAVTIHECSHYAALRLCGCTVHHVTISSAGVFMMTEEIKGGRGALCALAGPIGGLLLFFLIRVAPRLAICGLIHSIYNLLPLFPLDGGRAMECLLHRFFYEEKAKKIQKIIEYIIYFILLVAAIYSMIYLDVGVFPIVILAAVFVKNGKIKIPCKQFLKRVQ